jgi:YD repeat-containing protein
MTNSGKNLEKEGKRDGYSSDKARELVALKIVNARVLVADERPAMKQMVLQKLLSVVACMLMFCAFAPMLISAAQAQYIYDDLGRLSQVIDGQGNVATYQYHAVGNLLSITRNTGGVGAPTITAFMPSTGNAGASVSVSLTGTLPATSHSVAVFTTASPFFSTTVTTGLTP